MVEVSFTARQPWALLPYRPTVDRQAARAERDLYQKHFRYKRITRLPTDCPPWVMGQQLGWMIASPVSITMTPVEDVEFDLPPEEELAAAANRMDRSEMWRRTNGWIATKDTGWLRLYDFMSAEGWEGMFLPNGAGTVEWRLGWSVRVPERYLVLVIGAGTAGLEVPVGVLTSKVVNAMTGRGGFSIAVRPTGQVTLGRGDPVARLILLHPDSLQVTSSTERPDER